MAVIFYKNSKIYKNRYFRTWQFKILHGIHNTKRNLEKWKIVNDGVCEKCMDGVNEDIDHYFLNCPFNNNILRQIHDKIGNILDTRILMRDMEYITGMWTANYNEKTLFVIDRILFFGKMYIIMNRRASRRITFKEFTNFIVKDFNLKELM